jgi:hypothetical protein
VFSEEKHISGKMVNCLVKDVFYHADPKYEHCTGLSIVGEMFLMRQISEYCARLIYTAALFIRRLCLCICLHIVEVFIDG